MTRYHVWLNGLGLQAIDPAIFITDVQELAPEEILSTAARAASDGLHVLRRSRQSLSVAIRFAIREQQPARRSSILQEIRSWASQGGALATDERPGQRLMVAPGRLSAVSALRWTEPLTLTFTAYRVPYWEDEQAAQVVGSPAVMHLTGDSPAAPMDLRWKSTVSGPLELTVATPLSSITFRNVQASANQELLISHDTGVLTAVLGGRDILSCRTPESSDDLLLPCGQASAITVTANGSPARDCILTSRGRWL